MGFSNDGYFYYYIVILFSGLLRECASQGGNDCFPVTNRNDFKPFESSCYYVSPVNDQRSWENAQQLCNGFGGNLATISKKETLEFIKSHWTLPNEKLFWIGLYLSESVTSDDFVTRRKANWKWLDGTKYDWTKYVSQTDFGWTQIEPDKGESFVRLYSGKTFRASRNTTQDLYPYICQTNLSDAASSNSTSSTTSTASTSSTTSTPSITSTPATTFTPSITSTSSITSSQQDMSGGMPTKIPAHIPSGPNTPCGGNWTYNSTTKLCYILNTSEMLFAWTSAEEKCNNLGGQLASLPTQERYDAAVAKIRMKEMYNKDVWIGLMHERGADGNNPTFGWKWTDGFPYMFQKWANNEPSQDEKYVRMKAGEWLGINDGYYYNYLCQKEPMKSMSPDVPGSTTMQNEDPLPTDKTGVSGGSSGSSGSSGSDKSRILGPVLGVLGGAIIIALVGLVIFMKRKRSAQFQAAMSRLRIDKLVKHFKKTEVSEDVILSIENDTNPGQNGPIAATSQTKSKLINKDIPNKEFEMPSYATGLIPKSSANDKRMAPIYATVKNFLTHQTKPKLKKAASSEDIVAASESAYENTVLSSVIRVEELNDWVKQATKSKLIEKEYKSVPMSDPRQFKEFCNQEKLKPKNRYKGLVPYDSNRVQLSLLPNDPYSHYINASYIDSYKCKKTFIAAQGPTSKTANDFWRMIWEKSVKTIVMVSNQTEPTTGKMNFVKYWPLGKEQMSFGNVSVTLKRVENLPDYIVRHMSISQDGDIRIIKQFCFKAWPDHNVPKHAMALINFREKIRKEMNKGKDPVLVHCSAGVGRTGTYIAIDYLLEQAAKDGVVDFLSILRKLREQRTDMIQKLVQYQFLIRAVLEALTLGQTAIPSSEYARTVLTFKDSLSDGETRMQKQFQILTYYFTEEQKSDELAPGKQPENIDKNRDPNVLPAPSKRILLMTPISGKNDYINAVFVEGHRRKSAFMATHAPLQHTVVDFWRAVHDYNSSVVIMLCPKYYLKTDEVYFPEGLGEKLDITPFELESLEENEKNGIRINQLSLKCFGLEKHVLHFSLKEDLSGMSLEEKMSTVHTIYEDAKKWQQQQNEKKAPITVHCLEGTEWTGLYCTLSNLFDQVNEDQEVDVFHAVGQLRLARTEFVSSLNQYEMIYDILGLYLDQFNMYSNFQ